jgi:hypothetical protein
MELEIVVEVDTSDFERFSVKLPLEIEQAVRRSAFFLEGHASLLAPYDTGALKASIYTDTFVSTERERAIATARALWAARHLQVVEGDASEERASALGPIAPAPDSPRSPFEAVVAAGMEYAIYLEYGTSRMAARPYFQPAIASTQPVFESLVSEAIRRSS